MRRSIITLCLVCLIASFFVGCGGSRKEEAMFGKTSSPDMGDIPDWFLDKPEDDNYYIETGTAKSLDLGLAISKAGDDARMNLSKTLETKFEGLSKRFQDEIGTAGSEQILDQFTQCTKAVVSQVLSGATISKKQVADEGNQKRVYVLLQMSKKAAADAMMERMKREGELYTRFQASKAFDELNAESQKFDDYKKDQK